MSYVQIKTPDGGLFTDAQHLDYVRHQLRPSKPAIRREGSFWSCRVPLVAPWEFGSGSSIRLAYASWAQRSGVL